MTAFRIAPAATPGDIAAIQDLFTTYAAGLGVDLGYQGFDAELAGLPGRAPRHRARCCSRAERMARRSAASRYGRSTPPDAAR